jgi:hypothetical protein
MKKIPWHNPAQQTPPEGYRLLIPEEVDGRFQNTPQRDNNVLVFSIRRHYWKPVNPLAGVDQLAVTYAVPNDTPLPEGYTLIDGEVWQMEEVPKPLMALDAEEQARKPITATEVIEMQKVPASEQVAWDARVARVLNPIIGKAFEVIYRELKEENQRLKNELADAQATLKSIRSLLP